MLNKLRNSLAHQIEDPKRDELMATLTDSVRASPLWQEPKQKAGDEEVDIECSVLCLVVNWSLRERW